MEIRQIQLCTCPTDRRPIHPFFDVLCPFRSIAMFCCNVHENLLWIYHPWTVHPKSHRFRGAIIVCSAISPHIEPEVPSPWTPQKKTFRNKRPAENLALKKHLLIKNTSCFFHRVFSILFPGRFALSTRDVEGFKKKIDPPTNPLEKTGRFWLLAAPFSWAAQRWGRRRPEKPKTSQLGGRFIDFPKFLNVYPSLKQTYSLCKLMVRTWAFLLGLGRFSGANCLFFFGSVAVENCVERRVNSSNRHILFVRVAFFSQNFGEITPIRSDNHHLVKRDGAFTIGSDEVMAGQPTPP